MDMDQHRAAKPASAPGSKVMRDFKQIQESGGASVGELRDFLHSMKGKSPQEMLGTVAQSDLIRSTITATIGCIVLLAVLTGISLGYKAVFPETKSAKKAVAGTTAPKGAADGAAKAGATDGDKTATTDAKKAGGDTTPDLSKTLGIGETKTKAPTFDPFQGGGDDLLDGPSKDKKQP